MPELHAPGPARSSRSSRPRRQAVVAVLAFAVLLVGASACLYPAGDTSKITLIDTTTVGGWKYDYYRNTAYPCSIKGYQTFAIGTKVGSSASATRPLWVKMRGGGFGFFAENGTPQPTAGNKSEITLTEMLHFDDNGLMGLVESAPEGFRTMLVSMCSHDLYAGTNTPDPHNPNTVPGGGARPTNGLISVKAAIQFTTAAYPTDDYFLHGTSAGGAGTFHVAWGLQQQGIAPAGLISDSGVINQAWEIAAGEQGLCGATGSADGEALLARIDPDVGNANNQPDMLVKNNQLRVPVVHIWNHADTNSCGDTPMQCPMRDGTVVTMGAADCRHTPLRQAILAQGPSSRSLDLKVCVEGKDTTLACDRHVVTGIQNGVNSDPGAPADYEAAIMTWVRARMADD